VFFVHNHALYFVFLCVCRVHEAKSLQDGATYAVKVLPKATKKHKAREQLQSESTVTSSSIFF